MKQNDLFVSSSTSILKASNLSDPKKRDLFTKIAIAYNISVAIEKKISYLIKPMQLNKYDKNDTVQTFSEIKDIIISESLPHRYINFPLSLVFEIESIIALVDDDDLSFDNNRKDFEGILSQMDIDDNEVKVKELVFKLDNYSLSFFSDFNINALKALSYGQ